MKKISRIVVVGALCVMMLGLCSCMGTMQQSEAQQTQAQSRQYMAHMNSSARELQKCMDGFSSAVANNDIAALNKAFEQAQGIVDELAAIEAPSVLSEVHAKYSEGAQHLQTALKSYIECYAAMQDSAATDETGQGDASLVNLQMKAIQQEYSAGIRALREADRIASEL